MISLQLGERLARAQSADRLHAGAVHTRLVEALSRDGDLLQSLALGSPTVLDLIPAGGAAVYLDGRVVLIGRTPSEDEVRDVVAWLDVSRPDGVLAMDALSTHYPPAAAFAEPASGLIALPISRSPRDYVLWFRPEVLRTVTWAGDPRKPVENMADGMRLGPRASFAAWRETVRGCSAPWTRDEIASAQTLRAAILDVVLRRIDEIAHERELARARQDVLIAELDHRVKNTLATIQALVKYSATGAESLETFTRTVQMRLHAMARTHDLLTRSRWEGADLANLVEIECAPYGGRDRVSIAGPQATLTPKAALAISLALHELATNAAKHGALSTPEGGVEARWTIRRDLGRLVFRWSEHGGPTVRPPSRRGFGRVLLERSLALEFDGAVSLTFDEEGLVCVAEIPLSRLVGKTGSEGTALQPPGAEVARSRPPAALEGRRVLLVEDQALIAMEAQDGLESEGVVVVGPFGRLARALTAATQEPLDAALIDVDLDGERSWPVADVLAKRGVPFAFTTGFQAEIVFPERFLDVTVLAKPYPDRGLVDLVRALVEQRRTSP